MSTSQKEVHVATSSIRNDPPDPHDNHLHEHDPRTAPLKPKPGLSGPPVEHDPHDKLAARIAIVEQHVRLENCPTQAKTRLEWATRPPSPCSCGAGTPAREQLWSSSSSRKTQISQRKGEGHEFTRAAKSLKMCPRSAPEVCFLRPRVVFPQPPRAVFKPEGKRGKTVPARKYSVSRLYQEHSP
jgi:hypothetical protein